MIMANAIPYGKGTVSPISATLKEGLVPKDIIWVNLVFLGPDRQGVLFSSGISQSGADSGDIDNETDSLHKNLAPTFRQSPGLPKEALHP